MPEILPIKSMGSRAARILSSSTEITVRGVTSRGVYLAVGTRAVVFLTRDPTRGPYTLNIPGLPVELRELNLGDTVLFKNHLLTIQTAELTFAAHEAAVWQTSSLSLLPLDPDTQLSQVKSLVREVVEKKGWVGLAGLLPGLLELEGLQPEETDPLGMASIFRECMAALRESNPGKLFEALRKALGRGPGLTPSGDDLCAGVILKLNRGCPAALNLEELRPAFQNLVELAYKVTTTYSANLIEAAADGEADERLIAACDCVTAGTPDTDTAAQAVTHWGSSSGVDTLAGISLVCLAGIQT